MLQCIHFNSYSGKCTNKRVQKCSLKVNWHHTIFTLDKGSGEYPNITVQKIIITNLVATEHALYIHLENCHCIKKGKNWSKEL
jgi:hypothetical protein